MLIGFRVGNRQLPRDSLHFAASSDEADLGLQPTEDFNPPGIPVVKHSMRHSRDRFRLHGQRQPNISRGTHGRSFELRTGDPHYGKTMAVEQNTFAGDL